MSEFFEVFHRGDPYEIDFFEFLKRLKMTNSHHKTVSDGFFENFDHVYRFRNPKTAENCRILNTFRKRGAVAAPLIPMVRPMRVHAWWVLLKLDRRVCKNVKASD